MRCVPTPANVQLLASMVSLRKPYVGFQDVFGEGHLETVAGALLRTDPKCRLRRQLLSAHDGGTICLDWHDDEHTVRSVASGPRAHYPNHSLCCCWGGTQAGLPAAAPVLVLIAGLTSGSDASYVRHAAVAAAKRGMRCVVYNHCGVGGTPVTSPRLYCAAYTEDLRCVRVCMQAQVCAWGGGRGAFGCTCQ